MHRVRLINKDSTAAQHPVCGKSGKLYGQSVFAPQFGGPVFEMTMEAYDAAKFDIIGNVMPYHQWIPEFIEVQPAVEPVTVVPVAPATTVVEPVKPRKEKSLKDRAKAAGVFKKGMTDEQIKEALGFPD
jgi:hypothetical protein